jgi:molybdopterin/thiamine biosynthesis adenylyltransferase/rhodanese-related sulfurtransferase
MAIKNEARYQRQIRLKDFGRPGQQRLANARVLVIGAGGLGCPALQYLAAAGIGTLGIIDHDVVELSNLHRQILYTVADIGRLKADCAAERLSRLNPDINIIPYPLQLTNQNAALLISKFDLVIDGSDNFPTRYMVNDACVLLNIPLVYGALSEHEGQVGIFNVADQEGIKVNYRDVFPDPPQEGEVLNCAEAGVLGFLPGIIGTMQAAEAIKLLADVGEPLVSKMLIYNGYTNQSYQLKLTPEDQAHQSSPADLEAFLQMDYKWFCGIKGTTGAVQELDAEDFRKRAKNSDYTVIDVREPGESPEAAGFNYSKIPLSSIRRNIPELDDQKIILFCQSGVRSIIAAEILLEAYPGKEFYSLKGGILRLV